MGEEFLTVKDFAEKAGVSVQSIYKKLGKENNPIQRYLKIVDGVKYINQSALDILYSAGSVPKDEEAEQENKKIETTETKPINNDFNNRLIDILEKQLEEQRRQLEQKDKLIEEQAEQINKLLKRLEECNNIINNQQQLTALNIQGIIAVKDNVPIEEKEEARPQDNNLGFWKRLFKRG